MRDISAIAADNTRAYFRSSATAIERPVTYMLADSFAWCHFNKYQHRLHGADATVRRRTRKDKND